MKKLMLSFISFIMVIILAGCSSNSILEKYPQAEKDFTDSDYNQLETISNDGSLSYEELCKKYVETNLPTTTLDIIDRLRDVSEVNNLSCKKTDEEFLVSYDLMFKDIHNIGVGDMHTTIKFISDPVNFNLKKITYDVSELQYEPKTLIVSSIENNKEGCENIVSSTQNENKIKNKIYTISTKYYYMPIENETETIIINVDDIDESYQSNSEYLDNQLEEFDNQIDELEKSLE